MREDRDQRQKSRYVQILRLPWLSEMALKLGNYSALAKAFKASVRPEAFTPEVLEAYRDAWRQPGALTAMLNWYRALYLHEPPMPEPRSLTPPILVMWGDRATSASPNWSTRASPSAPTRASNIRRRRRTGSFMTRLTPCRASSWASCGDPDPFGSAGRPLKGSAATVISLTSKFLPVVLASRLVFRQTPIDERPRMLLGE